MISMAALACCKIYSMILGITGGMGCGKTTAAKLIAELGYERLDSDGIIRSQILTSEPVIHALRQRYGEPILDPQGAVDRARLASIIFSQTNELEWLERLLHPALFAYWRNAFASSPGRSWIVEVPLLFEKGLENWFDFTLCVTSTPEQQFARLEKRGITRAQAESRISKQLPLARKSDLADFVLGNDGALWFLKDQVSHFAEKLSLRTGSEAFLEKRTLPQPVNE